MPESTLQSGEYDGSRVGAISGPRRPDVDGCSGGLVISPKGGDVVGSAGGEITSSGLAAAIGSGVSGLEYTIGAWLVGSASCIIGDGTESGVGGATGAKTVGGVGSSTGGSTYGRGVVSVVG